MKITGYKTRTVCDCCNITADRDLAVAAVRITLPRTLIARDKSG